MNELQKKVAQETREAIRDVQNIQGGVRTTKITVHLLPTHVSARWYFAAVAMWCIAYVAAVAVRVL